MLQLDNRTPYAAERAVLLDLAGSEIWVVAVKATFDIRMGRAVLAEKQLPVCLVDEYHGEPGSSSIKYESELVFRKPGTDIVVNGHAYAPRGRKASRLDVEIRAARQRRRLAIYGDRRWKNSALGLSITAPEPFLKMPLLYERAFGGIDVENENSDQHGAERRNPIGTGFAGSRAFLSDRALPNIEDPDDLITGWNSRPRPVGLGFVCKDWEPRCRYVGTCDQAYMETRLPLYPHDFDLRFFLGAYPDLVAVPHLLGGESIELKNLTPDGHLAFTLPRLSLGFQTLIQGEWKHHVAKLGTVVIEPDFPRVLLTWHTCLPCHRKVLQLEKTRIFEKRLVGRTVQ